MEQNNTSLLSVEDLVVEYHSGGRTIHAVNGVSFDVKKGRTLGLVGETGAGKTSISKAILRILPDHATEKVEGTVTFEGKDLLSIPEKEMQSYRGQKISMIFQDPMTALNPVKTVVSQIAEVIQLHQHLTKAESKKAAIDMLEAVGIVSDRAENYPHQFSGGMKQRVIIAMALACNPELIIADEPTTALDVTIQAQVLDLIKNLREERGTSMILVTHDLGVVADVCDEVAVVYAGRIIEAGTLEDVFDRTSHPYTRGLFDSLPEMNRGQDRLKPIKGLPPDPADLPEGCAFAPRCPYADDLCRKGSIELRQMSESHFLRCIHGLNKEQTA